MCIFSTCDINEDDEVHVSLPDHRPAVAVQELIESACRRRGELPSMRFVVEVFRFRHLCWRPSH